MRARQFLALQGPIIVEHDGRKVVVLAFTIGLFGRVNAMIVDPVAPSAPRAVSVDALTFPPAIAVGPKIPVGSATLGAEPVSIGGQQGRRKFRDS